MEKFNLEKFSEENNSNLIADIKKNIFQILWNSESKGFCFHNLQHTLFVFERAKYLSDREKLSGLDKEILLIATLFHDIGNIESYIWHEYISASIAETYLLSLNYPEWKIDKIKKIIISSVPSKYPEDILEMIMKDSDIDNLWRNDFFVCSSLLRQEIAQIQNVYFSDKIRFSNVYKFINTQKFYTDTQNFERADKFKENVDELSKLLE